MSQAAASGDDDRLIRGVKFVIEPLESPVCWMAVVNDPDENRLVIHKRKAH